VENVEGALHAVALPACDVITLVDELQYHGADRPEGIPKRCRAVPHPRGARFTRIVELVAGAGAHH
jgi:hypothetical protein